MKPRRHHIAAAALVAAVWIMGPALAVIHTLVEEHSYCVEHAALEESSDSDSALASAAPSHQPGVLSIRSRNQHESGHESCPHTPLFTRDAITAELGVPGEGAALSHRAPPIAVCRTSLDPVSILRSAPKNSPPASA